MSTSFELVLNALSLQIQLSLVGVAANEEVRNRMRQAVGFYEDLFTKMQNKMVPPHNKRREACQDGAPENCYKKKKKRKAEIEIRRHHYIMDTIAYERRYQTWGRHGGMERLLTGQL
ncbi:hypothetical protein ElyMa_006156600 [Elysia marginata]|uniref:Uncharacterized protein n=1 Tax=Elysia marginata TaxID=1093978 RepID=A0AAV4GZ74_9GAST|nr:hypothetical protein ElyMa_006156600 [Elysia marginata]